MKIPIIGFKTKSDAELRCLELSNENPRRMSSIGVVNNVIYIVISTSDGFDWRVEVAQWIEK